MTILRPGSNEAHSAARSDLLLKTCEILPNDWAIRNPDCALLHLALEPTEDLFFESGCELAGFDLMRPVALSQTLARLISDPGCVDGTTVRSLDSLTDQFLLLWVRHVLQDKDFPCPEDSVEARMRFQSPAHR